jgi:GcrA cell cycle regulator
VKSASQIARELGVFDHCKDKGRNAVIGKAHRLDLAARPARPRRAQPLPPPKPYRPAGTDADRAKRIFARQRSLKAEAVISIEVLGIPEPPSLRLPLAALSGEMCRWPHGEPKTPEFSFCGCKSFNGLPYCEYHSRKAYRPLGLPPEQGLKREPGILSRSNWR